MIADFEQPLQTHGPWLYRRLFWETGMIGQVLYLEAEACLPETPRVWGGQDRYPDPAVASIVHEALANFGNAHTALDIAQMNTLGDHPTISNIDSSGNAGAAAPKMWAARTAL